MKTLTKEQYEELQAQYEKCGDAEGREYPSGEHMLLISSLNKLGFKVGSKYTAMELTEKLLCKRYKK